MKQFWREPLVHFALGALAIFAFFGLTGIGDAPDDSAIVIGQAEIDSMAARWQAQYRRPPTPDELDGLIDDAIRREIYVREGLRLGLDRDDAVVEQRMIQKMRFIEESELPEPSEDELREWFEANASRYAANQSLSFEQIYLGATIADSDWQAQLAGLDAGSVQPDDLRQPLSVAERFDDAESPKIARTLGVGFARQLDDIPVGRWTGPLRSGFGWHLVRISARDNGGTADFADVRQRVENDWRAEQRGAQAQASLDRLKKRYDIRVAGRE